MEMKDLREGVSEAIRERMSSPFLSSIVLSWPIVNYKLLMVVFGSGDYEGKLFYIDTYLYGGVWNSNFMHLAVWPMLVGGFFTLWYPRIDAWLSVKFIRLSHEKKRKVLFAEQEEPVAEAFQAEFFSQWNKRNDVLNASVAVANEKYRQMSADNVKKMGFISERLRGETALRISLQCGAGLAEARQLEDGWHSNTRSENKNFLFKLPCLEHIRKLLPLLREIPMYDEGRVRMIHTETIRSQVGVPIEEMEVFVETLAWMGLINSPERRGQTELHVTDSATIDGISGFFASGLQ